MATRPYPLTRIRRPAWRLAAVAHCIGGGGAPEPLMDGQPLVNNEDFKSLVHYTGCVVTDSSPPMEVSTAGARGKGGWDV